MLIAFSILFTVRPLAIGPVWSIVLVYLIFPLLFTFNLKIDRKSTLGTYAFFSILAVGNLLGNAYATRMNAEINVISEMLFLLGSFALILYILLSFKNEAVSKSEEASFNNYYLENVLSIAPIMMYTLDTNFRFKMVNPAYLDSTGYDHPEDVLGKTKKEIFNNERYGKMDLSLDQDSSLVSGEIEKFSGTRHLFLSDIQKMKWVAYNKVATRDQHGNITGVLCVMNDVTEITKNQKALDIKNEQLQHYIDSNLQLESFAFLASHDLKTPLRSISSFSQLLKNKADGKLSTEEKEYLDFIIDGSKSMNSLIADLLEYSTINKAEFTVSNIDLSALIEAVRRDLNIAIINENVSLEFINHGVESISGDFLLLKQLLNNLISNAIKYKNKGTDPVIQISCKQEDDSVLFKVKDNGIGIDEAYHEKIFLLLKRLHTSNVYDGTGIGLAVCKQIIEKHNGRIWVDSKLNEGSTFSFTLGCEKTISTPSTLSSELETLSS